MNNPHIYYHPFIKHMNESLGFQDGCQSYTGIEAIDCAEKYAESHEEIRIVPVDDDHFAGSIFVLVPHPCMGISVLFIPQLTNNQGTMFLYPNYKKILVEELNHLEEKYKTERK